MVRLIIALVVVCLVSAVLLHLINKLGEDEENG